MALSRFLHLSVNPTRIYGLDMLRAFAIVSVLITHSAGFVPPLLRPAIEWLTFDGVTLFFVLSGFLIGGILIKTLDRRPASRRTLADFWIKRWVRTLPPYFLVLTLVMVLSHGTPGFQATYYKSLYFFVQNLNWPHPPFFREAWSLAVEEWFYLVVPALTFLLINLGFKSKASLLGVAVLVLLSVTVFRYFKYLHFPVATLEGWDNEFRKIVVTRLDSLMYGVIAAYLSYYHRARWEQHPKALFGAGVALVLVGKIPPDTDGYGLFSCVFSFSATALGAMLTLPYLANKKAGTGVVYRCVTYTSLVSYSLYLLNGTVVVLFITNPLLAGLHLPVGGKAYYLLGFTCFWVASYVLAIPMYKYFEEPVLRLRSKLLVEASKKDVIVV